ncbi:hypothetical protein ACFORG_19975 [Lutimaribacter marinistellae]|uniref:Uncharacterized protein n=1 Tax=Lutimaribacter marinistellae TaxID=1820329 RepID=A0ABV7TL42_9RHOB
MPELDERVSPTLRNAPYPQLQPLDETLGPAVDPLSEAEELESRLSPRVQSLQSRARGLQTPVIDPEARDRLKRGIEQPEI